MRLIDADELRKQAIKELHITNSLKDVTDLIDSAPTIEPSVSTNSDDLIIKNGKGIQDGLYNIKDGEIFKYKAKGGTVRAYKLVESVSAEPNKSRPYGDCAKCIHTYGTLGCCITVNNEWVYDCDNGMAQYETTKAEPSGDLISRADAIEMAVDVETSQGTYERAIYVDDIMALPSADVVSREFFEDVVKANHGFVKENCELKAQIKSPDRQNYNLETIADIVRQLGHLDGCIADILDRPQVNSAEWVAQKEREFEELNRPKEDDKPQPYVPEASTERVVHCKDCVYSEEIRDGNDMFACNNMNGMPGYVRGDDFCSSGSL